MGLYQKIRLYKSLLIAFWSVNIVLIIVTLIASFRFFSTSMTFEKSMKEQSVIMDILSFDTELSAISALPTKSEDDVYELRKRIDGLKKALLTKENLPQTVKDFAESKKWKLSPTEWADVRSSLLLWVKNQISSSDKEYVSMNRSTKELIILGVLTLVFGIILPLVVFAVLTKYLAQAKESLEEKLTIWISQILKKIPIDGQKPWQNPILWFEIILAGFEIFAPQSRHPIILVLKDFIPVIRNEYMKAKSEPNHGHP